MIAAQLLELARRQHGAVSRRQMIEDVGIAESTVTRWASSGVLVPVSAGLYRVASHDDTFEHRCWAATLWMRGVGFISGTSAARLHGLRRMNSEIIEVTLPESSRRQNPPWIRLRYTNWYSPSQHRVVVGDGLIVASPLRMLFGLAGRLNQHRFDAAADDAWNLGLIDPAGVERFLGLVRASGKNGVRRVDVWLDRVAAQRAPAQSYLERDLIDAIEAVGLPRPERQYPLRVASGEVIHLDLAWPDVRLAVEPGHSFFHGLAEGQERDHRRDAACAALGWQVVRLNELMLADIGAAARLVAGIHRQRRRDVAS